MSERRPDAEPLMERIVMRCIGSLAVASVLAVLVLAAAGASF